MDDFPTMVYRSPGLWVGFPVDGKSTTYSYAGAVDALELASLLASGWYHTLPEAVDPSVRSGNAPLPEILNAIDDAPPTRTELKSKANELKIEYDGRISTAELSALISAALAKG